VGVVAAGTVTHRVVPDVPRSARNTITGHVKVKVRVSVDPTGNVSHAQFESMGPSKYFARLAMDSAQKWRFRPAQENGAAVPSQWNLLYEFGRAGTDVIPTEVSRSRR
jgi:TonB family protein